MGLERPLRKHASGQDFIKDIGKICYKIRGLHILKISALNKIGLEEFCNQFRNFMSYKLKLYYIIRSISNA